MTWRVAVTKVDNDDIESAVRHAVTSAGGLDELIKKDSRVLIKPNLCKPAPSGSGVITNARVIEAVTKMALDLSPKSVIIGDGAIAGYDFAGFDTQEAFEATGTLEIARSLGVEVRQPESRCL